MSDDKQNEVLTGYEQLKRRNRRRLVMASGLVAVSGILLAAALNSGGSNEEAQNIAVNQQFSTEQSVENLEKAAVLEPSSKDAEQSAAVSSLPGNESGRLSDDVEILTPKQPAQPEDIGPPLVLINDTLDDSSISGLEESEKIQKAEAAKREAAQRKIEERKQRLAEQRAARKAQQQRQAEADKEAARDASAKKRVTAAKAEKAERDQPAERNRLEQLEKAEKQIAERKASKSKESSGNTAAKAKTDKAKETAAVKEKNKAEPSKQDAAKKQTAAKESEAKTAKAKADNAKSDKPKTAERPSEREKGKTGKSAIQAGYAEKERALSLQRKMKAAGIDASITEVMTDKGKVYRVKSANYGNAKDAERDLNKLRVHGIAGQVTHE